MATSGSPQSPRMDRTSASVGKLRDASRTGLVARCTTLPPAGPATRLHPYTYTKRTVVGRATRECSLQEVILKVPERSTLSTSRTTARIAGVLFIRTKEAFSW